MAVDLAKVSLWLSTLARDRPLTFVDHAFRHGDLARRANPSADRGAELEGRAADPGWLRRPRGRGSGIGVAAPDPRSRRHRRRTSLAEPLARSAGCGRRSAPVRRSRARRVLRGCQGKGAGVTALRLPGGGCERQKRQQIIDSGGRKKVYLPHNTTPWGGRP